MIEKFKQIFGKTDDVFRKYPMVLLMAFLGAISLICFAESDWDQYDYNFPFVKFALVSCIGISLMFALKMLSERIGKELILQILGIIFLIFFYWLLPERERDFTEKYAFLIIPVIIMSHLLVSFAPFLGKNRELNFWQYNKNLFINIFLTAVFTGVLTGGVELAILAVDKLFDFKFEDKLYAETFYFFAIFGSCFIFLLFNEKGLKYLENDGEYPVILKFFTQYVLIPLLLIYAVILYFYSAKILINWELPRGWVSYLVLAYSVVGILALLLVHPLKEDSTKSWVKVFSKIFYYTLLPLIVLLFTAIFTRILEYGYTEPRYYVLLLAVWLTLVVLYFVFAKKPTIKFVSVSLFGFGLFALVFPYFNAFSVSKRSQKSELQKVLIQNNLLEKGTIDFNKKVSDTVVDEVVSKFDFLEKRNEKEFLLQFLKAEDQKILADTQKKINYYSISNDLRAKFKKIEYTKVNAEKERLEIYTSQKFTNVEGYQYVGKVNSFYHDEVTFIGTDNFKMTNTYWKDKKIELKLNNKETWNLGEVFEQKLNLYKGRAGRIPVDEISAEKDLGNYHIKIMLENLVRENTNNENIYFDDGFLLIRKK